MIRVLIICAVLFIAQAHSGPCDSSAECARNECCTQKTYRQPSDWPKAGVCSPIASYRLSRGSRCNPTQSVGRLPYPETIVHHEQGLAYVCPLACAAGLECRSFQCTPVLNNVQRCSSTRDCPAAQCCQFRSFSGDFAKICIPNPIRTIGENGKCDPAARDARYQCPAECASHLTCTQFDHLKYGLPARMSGLFDKLYHCEDPRRFLSSSTKPVLTTMELSTTLGTKPSTSVNPTADPGSGEA